MAEPSIEGQAQPGEAALGESDFAALLKQEFKPKSEKAQEAVETAVRTLAQQALSSTMLIPDDVLASIESMIKAIDETLTKQINLIIHTEEFQKVESAWRSFPHFSPTACGARSA